MKKKTPMLLAIIIFILILITACTGEDQIVEITQEDIEIVRNVTFEDVEEELTFVVEDFVQDYDYLTVTNLEFIQDELAVDSVNEVKKFNNIEMRLELMLDSDQAQIDVDDEVFMQDNFSELAATIEKELLDTLIVQNPHEFSRVITTSINFEDKENNLQHSLVSGHIRDSEIMTTLRNEESEAERAALEKTFDLIREDKEDYQLSRFGIEEDRLLIVFFDYGNDGEPNLTIEELSEKLHDLVNQDEDFDQYILNRADELIIMFNEQSFNYDINN